jgi:hypothetical protein
MKHFPLPKIEWDEDWIYAVTEDGAKISTTADKGEWLLTLTGSGSAAAADAGPGGVLAVVTGATDNNLNELQKNAEAFAFAGPLAFEARVAMNLASTSDFFIGLGVTDTSFLAGHTYSVGFSNAHAVSILCDATINSVAVSSDDTGEDFATATLATFSTTSVVLRFEWDGVRTIRYYVDGELVNTETLTDANVTLLLAAAFTPTIAIKTTSGSAAKTLWVDYVRVKQTRT